MSAVAKVARVSRTDSKEVLRKNQKSPAPKKRVDRARFRENSKLRSIPQKIKLTISERDEMILEHIESAARFAWTLLKRWRITLPADEVQSIANTALCEAAVRFDPSYGVSFKTFFFYHLRGLLLRDISRRVKDSRRWSAGDEILHFRDETSENGRHWPSAFVTHDNPEQLMSDEQLKVGLTAACEQLDPVSQEVVHRCFVLGESVSHIARDLGYCRCHISRVKTRALRILREMLKEEFSPSGVAELAVS